LGPAHQFARRHLADADPIREPAGVRHLVQRVRIEAIAGCEIARSIDPKRVVDVGATPSQKHVPEVKGLVFERIEPDHVSRLDGAGRIKQEQQDLCRPALSTTKN
jgi:hypothetical protein